MDGTLAWSDAQFSDRATLQHFVCADPDDWQHPPGLRGRRHQYHPRQWQIDLQSYIRCWKVPIKGDRVLLGREDDDLVAVARYAPGEDPDTAFMRALAIAKSRWGDGLGKEALEYVLNEISLEAWRTPGRECCASAWVHVDNEPSARTCAAVGMEKVDGAPEGFQEWAIMLPPVEQPTSPTART